MPHLFQYPSLVIQYLESSLEGAYEPVLTSHSSIRIKDLKFLWVSLISKFPYNRKLLNQLHIGSWRGCGWLLPLQMLALFFHNPISFSWWWYVYLSNGFGFCIREPPKTAQSNESCCSRARMWEGLVNKGCNMCPFAVIPSWWLGYLLIKNMKRERMYKRPTSLSSLREST